MQGRGPQGARAPRRLLQVCLLLYINSYPVYVYKDYYRFVFVLLRISRPESVCLLSVCLYQISVSVFASKCLSLFLYLFGHMGVFLYTYMSSVPCQISFSATQKKFFVKRNKSDNLRLDQLRDSGFCKFL